MWSEERKAPFCVCTCTRAGAHSVRIWMFLFFWMMPCRCNGVERIRLTKPTSTAPRANAHTHTHAPTAKHARVRAYTRIRGKGREEQFACYYCIFMTNFVSFCLMGPSDGLRNWERAWIKHTHTHTSTRTNWCLPSSLSHNNHHDTLDSKWESPFHLSAYCRVLLNLFLCFFNVELLICNSRHVASFVVSAQKLTHWNDHSSCGISRPDDLLAFEQWCRVCVATLQEFPNSIF